MMTCSFRVWCSGFLFFFFFTDISLWSYDWWHCPFWTPFLVWLFFLEGLLICVLIAVTALYLDAVLRRSYFFGLLFPLWFYDVPDFGPRRLPRVRDRIPLFSTPLHLSPLSSVLSCSSGMGRCLFRMSPLSGCMWTLFRLLGSPLSGGDVVAVTFPP